VSSFPGSPRLLKAGIVLLDPDTLRLERVIALQYNPETLTRSLQPQAIAGESGDRLEALRLKAPPVETIKLEVEIDATDQLERPEQNPDVVRYGIAPQLSALEMMLYPQSSQLVSNNSLAGAGTLEIAPTEAPFALFVFGRNRVLPVRLAEFSVTEEEFDPQLNPTRAKLSLGLRVLSIADLSFQHRGAGLYLAYQRQKELLAASVPSATLAALGIQSIP
jgi:hypothetical protein